MKTITLIFLMISLSAFSNPVETLETRDLEGLVPSFLLDQTGFESAGDFSHFSDENMDAPLVPLLPMFQSGALGRKTYVGGVVEARFLNEVPLNRRSELRQKIRQMKTQEGYPFVPIEYQGALYAIRSDYQIVYSNSTSVGMSLSFGGGNTVVIGNKKSFGLSLEMNSSAHIGKSTGLNVAAGVQKVIDDWMIGLGPDETHKVIHQAISITPLLMNYVMSPNVRLVDERGQTLELMRAVIAEEQSSSQARIAVAPVEAHSSEWKTTQGNLRKKYIKLQEFILKIRSMISGSKVVDMDEANHLVQDICDRLGTTFEVPLEIWPRCRVAATLTPNAWAYPTGDIYITAGLLGILSDVDSVMLVLGHEVAHVVGRHSQLRFSTATNVNYAASIVSSLANLGVTAFSLGGGMGVLGNVTFISWFPQMMASSMGSSYIAGEGLRIAMLAPKAGLMLQSREHESQADRLGQEAAYASGADLIKMSNGWAEFTTFFETYFPQKLNFGQRVMLDHPEARDRLMAFDGRSRLLQGPLTQFHRTNEMSLEARESYEKIHKLFRPYALAYGRELKKKFDESQRKKTVSGKRAQHFIQTMQGPHSQCIRHALGGH